MGKYTGRLDLIQNVQLEALTSCGRDKKLNIGNSTLKNFNFCDAFQRFHTISTAMAKSDLLD